MRLNAKAEWSTDAGSCGSGAEFSFMNDEIAKETSATGKQNEKAHGSFIPLSWRSKEIRQPKILMPVFYPNMSANYSLLLTVYMNS